MKSTPSALEDPKGQGESGGVYPCALEQREFKQSMLSHSGLFSAVDSVVLEKHLGRKQKLKTTWQRLKESIL